MVFVLDRHHKPLMPCTERRARILLNRGRAVVHRLAPFTIRLKDREAQDSQFQTLRLKLDPGSKTTGLAVALDGATGTKAILLGEVVHKPGIKAKLDSRRALRRGRRNRKTRYRKARFQNRRCPEGWLPPSLEARVDQTLSAVAKIRRVVPIQALSVEHVKFDTQLMQNPGISGVEYQRGTLLGYEVREYLLEKFGHECAYCHGASKDPVLEIEHMQPKSRGGSDRISNLAIACHACNQEKDAWTPAEWATAMAGSRKAIDHRRIEGCATVQARAKAPLRDAAMMNATRWRLLARLRESGLPVETGTGARTKMQRIAHDLPKEHYFDALCVGESTPERFTAMSAYAEAWSAKGRCSRQMCGTDRYGFPIRHPTGTSFGRRSRQKTRFGFQTGDIVAARVPAGKYAGIWRGRVAVRASGAFDILAGGRRVVQGISHRYCRVLQRAGGWSYEKRAIAR